MKKDVEIIWKNGLGVKPDDPRTDEERSQGILLIPRMPEKPPGSNPVVAVCGECGVRIRQVMGYVCSNPRCPTDLTSGG